MDCACHRGHQHPPQARVPQSDLASVSPVKYPRPAQAESSECDAVGINGARHQKRVQPLPQFIIQVIPCRGCRTLWSSYIAAKPSTIGSIGQRPSPRELFEI